MDLDGHIPCNPDKSEGSFSANDTIFIESKHVARFLRGALVVPPSYPQKYGLHLEELPIRYPVRHPV